MHICLLTPSFPPMVDGGVAISTGRLVQGLLQRGHQITVVTTTPPEDTGGGITVPPAAAQPASATEAKDWRNRTSTGPGTQP